MFLIQLCAGASHVRSSPVNTELLLVISLLTTEAYKIKDFIAVAERRPTGMGRPSSRYLVVSSLY